MLEPANPPDPVNWPSSTREAAFAAWLAPLHSTLHLLPQSLRAASSDASFRRYLRIDCEPAPAGDPTSLIVMDAPPPQEDVRPFVAIAGMLEDAGLNAPRVLAQDVESGFLLLTDLGSTLYLDALADAAAREDQPTVDRLMRQAVASLIDWQLRIDPSALPAYDAALLQRELALFPDWCLEREYGLQWNQTERATWDDACRLLVESALAQTTVAVHRDYMPRNLMLTESGPGILDFQDAVRGPLSYDLASLLRDAFISWDEEMELDIAVRYWEQARKAGLPLPDDFGEFWRQVEWMGLQRHLKVLGIFCRLKHRDGKPKYSEDLPRFFIYAHRVAARYNPLRPLSRLLEPMLGTERIDAYY